MDSILDRFEAAWQNGSRPEIQEYLAGADGPGRRELLLELIHLDLEYRVKRGDAPPLVENYLAAFPEELAAPADQLTLIFEEYQKRWQGAPGVRREEFLRRFPGYAAELPELLKPKWDCKYCRREKIELPEEAAVTVVCPRCGKLYRVEEVKSTLVFPRAAPAAPPSGQRLRSPEIPGYEILEEVGRGGFGIVYKARQSKLNRTVALKMVLTGELASAEDLARFRIEAESVARLKHPNIVQIYEIGETDRGPYFSMEFVEGGSLDQEIKDTLLPAWQTAQLIETLARAVDLAHQHGIIHRDLKPKNILLTGDGQPKIADFGLAKRLDEAQSQTGSGAVIGTPSYMAPEQAWGKRKLSPVGPAADVYGLGAIFYELLTGWPPFKAETAMDTMMLVLSEEAVAPSRWQPKVPRDLETICLKCLEKRPEKRYGSARQLAEELRRYQEGEPLQARPLGRLDRTLKWVGRHPAKTAIVALGLLVAVLAGLDGAAMWLWRDAEDARHEATQARDGLAHEKKLVEDALGREAIAKAQVTQAKEDLDQVLYLRRVSLAYAEWRDTEVARAEQLLAECPVKRRNWEWNYVYHLCHSERLLINGHTNFVHSVCFRPDGKRLASASGDNTVRVWDAATGQEARTLKGHTSEVTSVCFSPDGKRLASASGDNTVRVWDAATGQEALTLKGHTDFVTSVCFSPDGKRLASASGDNTVRVWDAATGQEARTPKGHTSGVTSVCFSPDGKRLASASGDKTVRVWGSGSVPVTGGARQ